MFTDQCDNGRKDCFPRTSWGADDNTFVSFDPSKHYQRKSEPEPESENDE